jgi:hypothetical protein
MNTGCKKQDIKTGMAAGESDKDRFFYPLPDPDKPCFKPCFKIRFMGMILNISCQTA